MKISISICPTDMEWANGDKYHEGRLLDAIRGFVARRWPDATITTLQVGHRQGQEWATIDGDEEAGYDLMATFWHQHAADESLFEDRSEAT